MEGATNLKFLMNLEDLTNYKLSKSQSDQKAKSQDGKVWDCVSLARKFGGKDKNATTFDEYKVAKSFIGELTKALKARNQNDVHPSPLTSHPYLFIDP